MLAILVLVIKCLGGRFKINCPSALLEILKLPEWNEGNFKIFKNREGDLSPKSPQPSMWFTPNKEKKRFILKLIYFNSGTNQRAGNYKITPLTVQCWLQSTVWLDKIMFMYILNIRNYKIQTHKLCSTKSIVNSLLVLCWPVTRKSLSALESGRK